MDPNRAPRKLFENDPENRRGVDVQKPDGSMEFKQISKHSVKEMGRPYLKIETFGKIS